MAFDVIFGGWLALRLLQRSFPHSGTMGRHAGQQFLQSRQGKA
jgi:hypothetical protein